MLGNIRILSIFFFIGMVLVLSPGCSNGNTPNSPPYAVVGPAEMSFESGKVEAQTDNLITEAPGDPDGDSVTFESDESLDYLEVDPSTGIIEVSDTPWNDGNAYDKVITVWTEDEHGLASEEFVVTLHFSAS